MKKGKFEVVICSSKGPCSSVQNLEGVMRTTPPHIFCIQEACPAGRTEEESWGGFLERHFVCVSSPVDALASKVDDWVEVLPCAILGDFLAAT